MKKSIVSGVLASSTLLVGLIAAILVVPATAFAQGGGVNHYYEDGYNINSWNGGPNIEAYNGNVATDNFMLAQSITNPSYWNIYNWDGASSYFGYCMGDTGNSSSDAKASLSGGDCTSSVPWGGNFIEDTCSNGEVAFYNVHWNGFLAPASNSNGAQFYLNDGTEVCYHVTPA